MNTATTARVTASILSVAVAMSIGVPVITLAALRGQDGEEAMPKRFCVGGTVWESRHEVPAVAREYDAGERFTRGNQALFHPESVQDLVLVNAQVVNNSNSVQEYQGDTHTEGIAIQRATTENSSRIRSFVPWFFVPRYDAFLVERTTETCAVSDSELFFGTVFRNPKSGSESPTGDVLQFIVESNAFPENPRPENPGRE